MTIPKPAGGYHTGGFIPPVSTTIHVPPKFTPTPTPIDPADIRPGDVVRIVREVTVEQVAAKDCGEAWLNLTWVASPGVTFLVSRPDPDAKAVEALAARAFGNPPDSDDLDEARCLLKALRDGGWDVVRRAES